MATRKAAVTTATSAAPAITRCLSSTSSATWSGAPCVPAMFTRPRVGASCWCRWSREPAGSWYKHRTSRRYFRADAAFASPEVYEYLEAEGFLYAIRLPSNQLLQKRISHLLTRPVGRPPKSVRRYYVSFDYRAQSWDRDRRVVAKIEWHPGELIPRFGFVVTNLNRPDRHAGGVLLQSARHGGAVDQGRQARDQMDAALLPEVPQQRGPASASRACLQSRQLHAHAGLATGDCALVADHAAGEADQELASARK